MNQAIKYLVIAVGSVPVALGQTQPNASPSQFEVASLRPTESANGRTLVQAFPGRLVMQNFSPRALIFFAYGVADYQISGGPAWLVSDRYDLQAKAADGNATVNQMEGPMLQALLEDRFRLALHRETRQLPVYEMTLASGSGKLQPARKVNCTPYSVDSKPAPAPAPGERGGIYCGFPRLSSNGPRRTLDGASITIEGLAGSLSRSQLHIPVTDKTGLIGTFDIHLEWTVDSLDVGGEPAASDVPTLFTALREQLGLKLESAKGPVEVLVIDHIDKPSPN